MPNHPNAKWMGLIAGLSHNMIIGCLMGSFSVMLASVESRMGVSRAESSLVGGLVIFGSAIIGAFVGPVMARYSLRPLMFLGAALMVAGFLILAFTTSYPLYIASYLLLFGPSMALAGSVGPATLVTRWFSQNRGLALGLVHLSLVVAVVPLLATWILARYGAQATYLTLGVMVAVILFPATLMIRDYPPSPLSIAAGKGIAMPAAEAIEDFVPGEDPQVEAEKNASANAASLTVPQILKSPVFWAIATVAGLIITQIMMLTFNMIQIAASHGITGYDAALLQSIMSFSGMAGSIMFGWVADKIGGGRGMALIALDCAILLMLLQLDLPYPARAVVTGLLGLHGAGMIPNVSRALAHSFGPGSFSRAFGMQSALSVPFTAVGIWAMGSSFDKTHSYDTALTGVAIVMVIAIPLALYAARKPLIRA
ncbi:MAG: MFS transporter [Novosphingobium sp.]